MGFNPVPLWLLSQNGCEDAFALPQAHQKYVLPAGMLALPFVHRGGGDLSVASGSLGNGEARGERGRNCCIAADNIPATRSTL